MKKSVGVTSVVSVAILLFVTVALLGGAAVWFTDVQEGVMDRGNQQLSTSLAVKNLHCTIRSGSQPDQLKLALRNNGGTISASDVDVYIYRSDKLEAQFESLDWSDKDFVSADGFDTVTLLMDTTSTGIDAFTKGFYQVEIAFSRGETIGARRCYASEYMSPSAPVIPPVTSDNYTDSGWQSTAQTIEVRCTDNTVCRALSWELTNEARTVVKEGSVTGNSSTLSDVVTVGESGEGVFNLSYTGTDENGNTSNGYSLVKVDKTPPAIALADDSNWFDTDFTKTVDEEGGSTYAYRVDDGNTGSWSDWMSRSKGSVSVSVGNSADCTVEGENMCRVEVRVTDALGRSETSRAAYNIKYTSSSTDGGDSGDTGDTDEPDTTPPSTTITSPDEGSIHSDNFTVSVDDTDNTMLTRCSYRITDQETGSSTGWQTRTCGNGFEVGVGDSGTCSSEGTDTCLVEVRAEDEAGQTETDAATYTIDTGPPLWYTSINLYSDWENGIFQQSSASRNDYSGVLGLGYLTGQYERDLIGYWPMDTSFSGDDGTVDDYSRFGHDGVAWNGTSSLVTGVFGTDGAGFDGRDDLIEAPYDFSPPAITMAAWIRPTNVTGHHAVLSKFMNADENWHIRITDGDVLIYDDIDSADERRYHTPINAGEWTHVAAVLTRNNENKLYVDGTLVGSGSLSSGNINSFTGNFFIGARKRGDRFNYYFEGHMDEVRVYDHELASVDIRNLYFQGPPFSGTYQSGVLETTSNQSWETLQAEVSIPTNTAVNVGFQSLNSDGTVIDSQTVSLENGVQNYSLSVRDSPSARFVVAGSSDMPTQSWAVTEIGIFAAGNGSDAVFTDDATPAPAITGPDESATYSSNFTVTVDDVDVGSSGLDTSACQYRVHNGVEWSSWSSRSCNNGFEVTVGQDRDCNMTGTCRVEAKAQDNAGNIGYDFSDFSISTSTGSGGAPFYEEIGGGAAYVTNHPDKAFCTAPEGALVATTSSEFLNAVSSASAGDVVYVPGDVTLDLTGDENIRVPGGVTLASDRGCDGSEGAMLLTSNEGYYKLLRTDGDDIVITGFEMEGWAWEAHYKDDPDTVLSSSAEEPSAVNIQHDNVEVYNNHIYGFSGTGIEARGSNEYIHHNNIHHSQKFQDGYGVDVNSNAPTLIEYNFIDYTRHSVAGNGGDGTVYTVRYNVLGPKRVNHQIDMHGDQSCDGRSSNCGTAGEYFEVYCNTMKGDLSLPDNTDYQENVNIRGEPLKTSYIYNNWLFQERGIAVRQYDPADGTGYDYRDNPSSMGDPWFNMYVENNPRGSDANPSCDIGAPRAECEGAYTCTAETFP